MPGPNLRPIVPRGPVTPTRGATLGALNDAMRDVVADGKRKGATYPTQVLTKTRYIRTNTLKRSWSSRVDNKGSSIVGTVGSNANIAPYNVDVQGPEDLRDAMFERAGWTGVEELVELMLDDLERRTQDAIDGTIP